MIAVRAVASTMGRVSSALTPTLDTSKNSAEHKMRFFIMNFLSIDFGRSARRPRMPGLT
jgi:hypothetical protein